jgi:hypothetical protein
MKCNQQALFRYTWAGRDESFCCLEHAQQLQGVAQAIGYYVQLIPLSGDEQMKVSCQQEVRANKVLHPTPESGGDLPAVESNSENVLPAEGG